MNEDFKKIKELDLELYPFAVVFCLLSEKGKEQLINEDARTIFIQEEKNYIFLYLKNNSIPILVHELFHVVEIIMYTIGQKIGEVPNETWAYLIGYLTNEGIAFLKNK